MNLGHQRYEPTAMPTLSPDVGAHLLKAIRSQDLDEAFEKVLSEYLELKIAALQETTDRLEEKWGMEFSTFRRRLADDDLPANAGIIERKGRLWWLRWRESAPTPPQTSLCLQHTSDSTYTQALLRSALWRKMAPTGAISSFRPPSRS